MPTYIQLANTPCRDLPSEFQDGEIRFPECLVEHFLKELTRPGDIILDPFAGYGTTLLVAESLGRTGYGLEFNESKVKYVRGLLKNPERLVHGDARILLNYDLPTFDLCFTSPPYTTINADADPLTDYSGKSAGYSAYLFDIRSIFSQLARMMKPSARLVVEVANLKDESGVVTPLAWDVATEISRVLRFDGETVICWDQYGHLYDHSYCLQFSKA